MKYFLEVESANGGAVELGTGGKDKVLGQAHERRLQSSQK